MVVGNPPWNEITIEELAFYALREPGLRGLPNLADRRRRIAELDEQNPTWHREFEAEQARLKTVRAFFKESGGYELQGVGDKDLYQLFCERYSNLVRQDGRLGVVLPRTAFLAQGARGFRQWLFGRTMVRRVDFLLNSGRWAFDMEPRYTVGLLADKRKAPSNRASFEVSGPSANLDEFEHAVRSQGVGISVSSLGSARVVPLMPSQMHADVLAKLRRGVEFGSLQSPEVQETWARIFSEKFWPRCCVSCSSA